MNVLVPLYLGLLALVGLLVFALLPLGTGARRALAAGVFAVSAIALFIGGTELLSRPKPIRAELLRIKAESAEVLMAYLVEGEAIYLWLLLPGETGPRAYALPWDKETARELHEALEKHGRLMMRLPFQRSWEDRGTMFHPIPQPKYPDKFGTERPEAPTKRLEM